MSTRCQVVVRDSWDQQIWFYRHSDGYPEGVGESLSRFAQLVHEGKIRDNAEQSAGWLILLGAVEYQTLRPEHFPQPDVRSYKRTEQFPINEFLPSGWKCGAYEPCETGCLHGDIEFLYVVDLPTKRVFSVEIPSEQGPLAKSLEEIDVIFDPATLDSPA